MHAEPLVTPAAPAGGEAAASGPEPTHALPTVSVRSLCEFTAKQGDLDRRFTPTATALEGIQGQQTIAGRRGPEYEAEITLEAVCGSLRVRGRADGFDPRRGCLEEIKTIRGRPDDIPANRRLLHWAQLQTYGALFCQTRGLPELTLCLVYFDVASQSESTLQQVFGAEELQGLLEARCAAYLGWALQEAAHRLARDQALAALPFPLPAFRPGQRALAAAVYRAASRSEALLVQAPTGIGKTLGTLFPALRAMAGGGIDKLAYLTCKGTGRLPALEALHTLREGTPGHALRVLALVPKEQGCEHPESACHPEACPLARGFYDRLPAARAEAVHAGWLDAATQRQVALRHGICPYHLGQDLLRWADVLVGDVHHLFDANGQLWGLAQALDWQLTVLVDEAHNLVDRVRLMYSADLGAGQLQAAADSAPAAVRGPLQRLAEAALALAGTAEAPYAVLESVPDAFTQALQGATGALAEHFQRQPLAVGPLLQLHFALQRFARLVEALDKHALFEVQQPVRDAAGDADGTAAAEGVAPSAATAAGEVLLAVRNVAPAPFLRQRLQALHGITLFSATLAPPQYTVQLLGLPEHTGWVDVPPAFPAEHLQVQVADAVSTRFAHRERSLARLVDVLARQFQAHPGNYLAFFSSFEYLDKAAALLALRHPAIPQWRQDRRMGTEARQAFLDRFCPQGQGIGFAVLGGVFAEGVDLPGSRLIGAFIATLGLPPVSPAQDALQQRLQQLFGSELPDAELVPAMQKVVQAAGRVLRTPQDRGWLWLLDDRYRQPQVVALLPKSWGLAQPRGMR